MLHLHQKLYAQDLTISIYIDFPFYYGAPCASQSLRGPRCTSCPGLVFTFNKKNNDLEVFINTLCKQFSLFNITIQRCIVLYSELRENTHSL